MPPSNFCRCRLVQHFELAQLFHERCAAQPEKARGMSNGAARAGQRLSNEGALDLEQMVAQVESFRRQFRQRFVRGVLGQQRSGFAIV